MESDNIGTSSKLRGKRNILLLALFALATMAIFDLGTISLSFVFGAILIVFSLRDYRFFFVPRGLTWFLFVFVTVALFGLVITEVPADKTTLVRAAQLVYWFLLAVFVYNTYDYLDKILLSKVVLLAALLFIVLDVTLMTINQNSVAFTVVIMGPLGYYFLKRYSYKLIYALLLLFLMLLNGSRTGAILAFVQTILFFFLFTPRLNRYVRVLSITVIVLAVSLNLAPVRIAAGKLINPINERVGEFLINPDEVFRNDMSWLQRRAQINKGLQIFREHTLLGIGIFNFPQYVIDIDVSNIETDRKSIRNIDNRSAHNSYLSLLAETGILGFSSIVLMFVFALIPFYKKLNQIGGSFEGCVFISTVGLLGYFYFISGFFGSSAWLIYGLILGASEKIKTSISY
jgi:O-antigen ligase